MPSEGHYRLYYVKLAYRAEVFADIEAVNSKFREKINPKDGYFRTMHWEQMGMLPDFTVRFELAVWSLPGDNPQYKLSKAVQNLIETIKECEDCHVILETLNYESSYLGERSYDEEGHLGFENDLLIGINQEMRMVDEMLGRQMGLRR